MLFDVFGDVNWLAVIVAGLAYFALGAVWYTNALFGRQYRSALGLDPEEQGQPDPVLLGVNLIGWLLASLALALVVIAIGADSLIDGVVVGLVAGVGMVATHQVVNTTYDGRNSAILKIHVPYTIIGFVLMGAILAMWR